MFSMNRGSELYEYRKDYVVFDLETTGLDTKNDRIVEIGAVRVRDGQITDEFATLVNPECEIPQKVIDIHGITNEMVKDAPTIAEALLMFNEFIGGDILVGQNIRDFDLPFIWRDCEAYYGRTIANDYIDNLTMAMIAFPYLESHASRVLEPMFGIKMEIEHRALYDSIATQALYEEIGKMAEEKLKHPGTLRLLELTKASKFISLILRHKPETIGITLDEHGWANVDELIAGIAKSRDFNMEMLEEIVRMDEKQRYSFNEDKTLIRANQGHSIPVDVELKKEIPPEYLYHGTGEKYCGSIEAEGLNPKSRLYVHLSGDIETAVKVGSRHGKPVVYRIAAGKMKEEGYEFFRSVNGVWLIKEVPVKYMERVNTKGGAFHV